jgi:hypothetical protein
VAGDRGHDDRDRAMGDEVPLIEATHGPNANQILPRGEMVQTL